MNISYSRVASYLRCPYAHYLGYVEGFTPIRPVRPLQFGTDFHKLLEYRGDKVKIKAELKSIADTFYEMPASWQNDLGDNYPQDIAQVFKDYLKVYKHNPLPDVTERRFEIPIFNGKKEEVLFVGVIDGLYHTERGTVVEEHKTFSRKPDASFLVMNTQKCLYAKAVELLDGSLPNSVMWDYIKSVPADEPIWLSKSHRFSSAKSEKITPYSVIRAAKRQGLAKQDVKELIEQYRPNVQNFFFRVTLDFIPEMVEKIWTDFLHVAKEIYKHGETNKVMNVTKDCSYCKFYSVCYAQMTGGDVSYVLKKDFTRKE